jgi:hypothetical protein
LADRITAGTILCTFGARSAGRALMGSVPDPMCAGVGSMPIKILALQGWSFCATPACKIVTYRQRIVGKQGPGPRVYLRSLWVATGLAAETAAVGERHQGLPAQQSLGGSWRQLPARSPCRVSLRM